MYTNNVYRSKLTDEHLKSFLIIGTSKIGSQLQNIVSKKLQLHISHWYFIQVDIINLLGYISIIF